MKLHSRSTASMLYLGDHSRQGLENPDARLVGTHARFCRATQLLTLARSTYPAPFLLSAVSNPLLASYPFRNRPVGILSRIGAYTARLFAPIWRVFPRFMRGYVYEVLASVGRWKYGMNKTSAAVQRLPFGLYLKHGFDPEVLANEHNALHIVQRNTRIPCPRAIDLVASGESKRSYLLTTTVPGITLAQALQLLSDQDLIGIAAELTDYAYQIREIQRPKESSFLISNTLGSACRDPRIRDCTPIGPFADEAAFSQNLLFSDDPSRRGHDSVFTHADLNPRNILVDRVVTAGVARWRITGIVDWETAGYYPEYWEFTKSMFESFRWPRRYNGMVVSVFREFGDYSGELAVERRAWESGDGV